MLLIQADDIEADDTSKYTISVSVISWLLLLLVSYYY